MLPIDRCLWAITAEAVQSSTVAFCSDQSKPNESRRCAMPHPLLIFPQRLSEFLLNYLQVGADNNNGILLKFILFFILRYVKFRSIE